MRRAALAIGGLTAGLLGCGYVGPVVPPSPEIPAAVTDLAVVERGDKILITFNTPLRTTDNLSIRKFSEIDLRVGTASIPFDFDQWAAAATRYQLTPPPPNEKDFPRANPMSDAIPASEWSGKRIAIAVRTAVKRSDHYSPWSNRIVLTVAPPLQPPVITVEATAQGVRASWLSEGEGVAYRVYRQGPGDKQPVEIGTSDKPEYIDTTAQYDTRYEYSVVAVHGSAESLMSKLAPITPVDVFPPSIPAGVTALAAPESIELSWQRNAESDLKGYYLYRSVDGGPFVKLGGLLQLPTYSDRDVAHGKTYRYEVSSVDQKDNESEKSKPVEVRF